MGQKEDVSLELQELAGFGDDMNDDWMELANCAGMAYVDSDYVNKLFFPDGHRDPYKKERHAICDPCPVRKQCEIWGNRAGKEAGAWGGYTGDERRARRGVTLNKVFND